ncbi:hypothetical protein Tco_0336356 [Tanacetum coccineum]
MSTSSSSPSPSSSFSSFFPSSSTSSSLDRQYLAIQSFEQEALLLKKHYDEYKDDADSSSATKKQRTSSSRNDGHDRLAVEHPTYEDDTLGKYKMMMDEIEEAKANCLDKIKDQEEYRKQKLLLKQKYLDIQKRNDDNESTRT